MFSIFTLCVQVNTEVINETENNPQHDNTTSNHVTSTDVHDVSVDVNEADTTPVTNNDEVLNDVVSHETPLLESTEDNLTKDDDNNIVVDQEYISQNI